MQSVEGLAETKIGLSELEGILQQAAMNQKCTISSAGLQYRFGLAKLHNCLNQFLIVNLFLYVCTCPISPVSLENPDSPRHIQLKSPLFLIRFKGMHFLGHIVMKVSKGFLLISKLILLRGPLEVMTRYSLLQTTLQVELLQEVRQAGKSPCVVWPEKLRLSYALQVICSYRSTHHSGFSLGRADLHLYGYVCGGGRGVVGGQGTIEIR